jgi:hypothetical protein
MPRVNFMIDPHVWSDLESIPRGERSRVVNEALADWLKADRRRRAAKRMDQLREKTPGGSSAEIVRILRDDRTRRTK